MLETLIDDQYLRGLERVAEEHKSCIIRLEDERDLLRQDKQRLIDELKNSKRLLDSAITVIRKYDPKAWDEAQRIIKAQGAIRLVTPP